MTRQLNIYNTYPGNGQIVSVKNNASTPATWQLPDSVRSSCVIQTSNPYGSAEINLNSVLVMRVPLVLWCWNLPTPTYLRSVSLIVAR